MVISKKTIFFPRFQRESNFFQGGGGVQMLISIETHITYDFPVGGPDPYSDFIWDFGKLPFPTHLGKYFNKIGKIRAKIHEIGKIKAIFGLGKTPIYGLKNG